MIYHITTPENYKQDFDGAFLTHASLPVEGFIHCATKTQVAGVLERYFGGINEITILHLEESLLTSELKYEVATANESFPHIFGKINKEAVVEISHFSRNENDNFNIGQLS